MTTLDNPSQNIPNPEEVPYRPVALRYGLIGGLILVALSTLYNLTGMMDYTGQSSNLLPSLLNYGTMIAVIVMAIKFHRDEELGGYIAYGRCIGIGALIGLIIGAITGAFSIIYFNLIDPDMIDEIMGMMEEQFADQGMDENAMDMALSWTRSMFSPVGLFLLSLLSGVIGCVIFSLIIGLFMKKDPPLM